MDGYATHAPLLAWAVTHSRGPVLELGAGWYSTPLLHELVAKQGRLLITCESDPEWLKQFAAWHCNDHAHVHVPLWDWDELPESLQAAILEEHFGLVFVDHAPAGQRIIDAERFWPHCEMMVFHDVQAPMAGQAFRRIRNKAPFSSIYDRLMPHTGVCAKREPDS